MGFEYLTPVSLERAKAEYAAFLKENGLAYKTETVNTQSAAGRITAQAVYAHICAPHYNACAMDGIALSARETFNAGETTPVQLTKDMFVPVDTGDPLPEGCDAVVMIEDVIYEDGGVKLYKPAAPWQHVRQIGEDVCAGDMLLPSFTEITPSAIGGMLAGGVMEVCVIKKPVVGIIPTGDEIIPPTAEPGQGDIIEFNSSIFSAMLNGWGAEAAVFPIVKDDPELIENALREAVKQCDVVILNAGSSAGREDYSAGAMAAVGKVLFHGVAIKPGKPAILGVSGQRRCLAFRGTRCPA